MTATIIRFCNILLVALLAGTSFGIWVGFNPLNYSASTYIEQQQHLIASLNTLMTALVVIATLVTIVSAFLQRQEKFTFVSLLTAAFFLASCIVISRFGNLPIQTEILSWSIASPPDNWTEMRDKWWTFHILRTVVELIALVIIAWTSVTMQHKK
ncbi:DUF1772 domain-containing protein [Flavobacterium pedocola]